MLIDTHTHLYLEQFDSDIDEVINRALEKGVDRFYLPNIDSSTTEAMLALETRFPERCFAMMGLHPCSVKDNYQDELDHVRKQLDGRTFCAIGEIGIDLYWDKTHIEEQKDALIQQIHMAMERDLPIVIHSREATDIIIDIVRREKNDSLRGIFHCFTGSLDQAKEIIDLGFLLGIGGVLTYKNTDLRETLASIPLDHIVLETDSPYLAPVPYRGKRNESGYIYHVADTLARLKGITITQLGEITSQTALNLFKN